MANRTNLNLDVDLQRGVVPISKAASSLAALIKRAHTSSRPVIVTQKGYPTGVILPIELFTALKAMANGEPGVPDLALPKGIDAIIDAMDEAEGPADGEDDEPKSRRRASRHRKEASPEPVEVGV
jgi:prevent-host-death family protein